jgi:hypothetical protein
MSNCLEVRRRLLAAPRERSEEVLAHVTGCSGCARFADDLAALDRKVVKATRIPVPEGLNERILLAQAGGKHPRAGRVISAAAAALLISIGAVTLLAAEEPPALAAETVAQAQTAVSAISMVLDEQPARAEPPRLDPALSAERLNEVGLALKKEEKEKVLARYVGKCHVSGRACEQIELLTYDGYVSVILMEDERAARPVMVADRRMAALLSPAPHGAYIVIAQTPRQAKRAQKLFERS